MRSPTAIPPAVEASPRSGSPSVCALAGGALGPFGPGVTVVQHAGALGEGLRRGLATGADWIWVLDGSAAPRPGALDELLGALERTGGLPDPVLLGGVVVDAGGRVDEARAAWYRRAPTELAMAAAERRLLPIRASAGPVLVSRRGAEAEPPRERAAFGAGAVLEWTARLLRDGVGYLVPASEYVAAGAARDPALDPLTAARLVGGRAFSGTDRLRVGFELAERARRRARSPAS